MAAAGLAVACAAAMSSCGRDATPPLASGVSVVHHGLLSFEPVFPRLPGGMSLADVVQFEKVRVVLHRADGSVALDTTVLFPVGADSVALAANVQLAPSSGSGGEVFKLDLGYLNSAGEVVFKGGPVDLTVLPKGSGQSPPPVQIPVKYSGPGASATKVVVSPRSITVTEGQGFAFTAAAMDASGAVIANTPIIWASLDPTRAVLGASSAGTGRALTLRGEARIAAQLLTGPADTVIVSVLLLPRTIALQSGDGQKGAVSTALAQPIAVKVVASDGVAAPGVNVTFAVATGGGSVAQATVATDASGIASTAWTLGPASGAQTATATAAGLSGSPVTFSATARSVAPVRLVIASGPPASNAAGSPLPVTVQALDAQGDLAKIFTGQVTLTLADGSTSAALLGTLSATAVAGVATFTNVRINVPGTGYAFTASASGLQSATTSSFAIVPGPAQRLEFGSYPVFGATAGPLDAVAVIARDAAGNVATSYTGTVTLSLLTSSSGTKFSTPPTSRAVAGVATFDAVLLTTTGEYQFGATADGLVAAKGPVFPITPGPATSLVILSGSGQTANAGSALASPIVFGLTDRYGNRTFTSGLSVALSASNGGYTSPSSGTTDAGGSLSAKWTLGSTTGTQTLSASSAGLASASVTATALAGSAPPASGGDLVVLDDVNALDNSYGLGMSGGSYIYPGNAQFVRNLVNFTPTGTRAAANKVLLINDRGNSDYIFTSQWSNFAALLGTLGLTTTQTSQHSAVTPVPDDVKMVILHTPGTYFSTSEINGLKSFASQGGRIFFMGENMYYYTYQALENAFIRAMGSPMTVVPDCAAWGEIVRSVAHPLTSGIAASGSGGFYEICASYHTALGTGDSELFIDSANRIVGSVLKINYTPSAPALMAPLRALRAAAAPKAASAPAGQDLTIGPPRRP